MDAVYINTRCGMFCDFIFGYQHLPEHMQRSYRAYTSFYPQPVHLKKGETVTNTLRWTVPDNAYSGTYRLNVGIAESAEMSPVDITVKGKKYKRFYISDIELAWSFSDFEKAHTDGYTIEFERSSKAVYDCGIEAEATVRDLAADELIYVKAKEGADGIYLTDYVSFRLVQRTDGDADRYILDEVTEKEGFELLEVRFPTFINKENSTMITSFCGGRSIEVKNAYCLGFEKEFQQINLGLLKENNCYSMIYSKGMDNSIHFSVYERNGVKYGSLGITLRYKLRKHGSDKSVKVLNPPEFSIIRDGELSAALAYIRRGKKRPNDFYDRGILYYYQIQCGVKNKANSFKDALDRVKLIHNMTGGVKQVVLLRGFQHNGHDTGYPDVFTINKAAGTLEDLAYVIEEGKKYNAVITFHDNYDDSYIENGYYDPDIISLDEYNKPYKGWIWVSGLSTLISLPKYVKSGKMQERVKKTLEMYPVKSSYHIDVLSCEPRRYDYDENIRMAADEFVEYKKAVVKEFNKYGLNVTSEGTSEPFVGIIGHAWSMDMCSPHSFYPNEEIYPLFGMVFHSFLPCSGRGRKLAELLSGAEMIPDIYEDPLDNYKETFYLFTLPMGMLYDKTIDGYEKNGLNHKVLYSDNSMVEYNEENGSIEVMLEGEYLTKYGSSLVKGYKDDEYLGYTQGGAFEFPFDKEISSVCEVGGDESMPQDIVLTYENGILKAQLKPGTAFKITVKA